MPTLLNILAKSRIHPGMECTEQVEDTEAPHITTDVPRLENSRSPEDKEDEQ